MLVEPNCSIRKCKHFEGAAGEEPDQGLVCTAFPKGIPYEIAYGADPHDTVHPAQEGTLVYEQSYNPKADGRLVTLHQPCFYCTHLTELGTQNSNVGWKCPAFPEEIPPAILARQQSHTAVIEGQTGTLVYESREFDYPDGFNFVTFDGDWINSQGQELVKWLSTSPSTFG